MKILHIGGDEKFTPPLYNFLENNFDMSDHFLYLISSRHTFNIAGRVNIIKKATLLFVLISLRYGISSFLKTVNILRKRTLI